jgi:hypothetical protein
VERPEKAAKKLGELLLALRVEFGCLYAIRRLFIYKAIINFVFTTLGGIFFPLLNI